MATITEKLQRIQGRATAYELVISNGESSYLVQYTRRGTRALQESMVNVGPHLVSLTRMTTFDLEGKTARLGDWTVRFSGRTEHEAIVAGELAFVGDLA